MRCRRKPSKYHSGMERRTQTKARTRHGCALCKGTSKIRRKHSLKCRNHFNSLVVLQTKTCSRKTYFSTFDLC